MRSEVGDGSKELFEEVFHGAQAHGTPVFVHDDRHMGSTDSKLFEHLVRRAAGEGKEGRPSQASKGDCGAYAPVNGQQVLGKEDARHIARIVTVYRDSAVQVGTS